MSDKRRRLWERRQRRNERLRKEYRDVTLPAGDPNSGASDRSAARKVVEPSPEGKANVEANACATHFQHITSNTGNIVRYSLDDSAMFCADYLRQIAHVGDDGPYQLPADWHLDGITLWVHGLDAYQRKRVRLFEFCCDKSFVPYSTVETLAEHDRLVARQVDAGYCPLVMNTLVIVQDADCWRSLLKTFLPFGTTPSAEPVAPYLVTSILPVISPLLSNPAVAVNMAIAERHLALHFLRRNISGQ